MKITSRTVLALICLSFIACSKKNEKGDPKPQIKLLTKIAKVSRGATDTAYTYISYDNKNRISQMKTGNTIRVFSYNGNDLISIINKDLSGKPLDTVLMFTYTNGVIATGHAPSPMPWLDYSYTYNVSNGRIIKRNGPPQYTHEFTYTGNNLASFKLEGSGTTTYDYGLDKSPFYNSRYRYYVMLPTEGDDIFSENDVIKYTYATTPYFRGANYSYVVGNDGLPKTMTIQATQFADPEQFSYTEVVYTYQMFDVVN